MHGSKPTKARAPAALGRPTCAPTNTITTSVKETTATAAVM